jgi:hypothetical protein
MGDIASDSPLLPIAPTTVFETPDINRQHSRLNNVPDTNPDNDVFQGANNVELMALTRCALAALQARGIQQFQSADGPPPMMPTMAPTFPPPPTVLPSRQPDVWENAKVEKIICAGLHPLYDGSSDKLILTLNLIHIKCKNEV